MGGYSSEYQISLKSGNVVFNNLDCSKFKGYCIHIFKDKWVYVDQNSAEFPINKNDFSVEIKSQKVTFDAVFNAIHGTPGEDGLLQAYFELLNIKQTSCDYYQAALTFNKRDLLSVLKPYGIPSATSYYLNLGDTINTNEIINKGHRNDAPIGRAGVGSVICTVFVFQSEDCQTHRARYAANLSGTAAASTAATDRVRPGGKKEARR